MEEIEFSQQLIRLGQRNQIDALKDLVKKAKTTELIKLANSKIGQSDGINFWNYLLRGCYDENKTKKFEIVKAILNELNKVEVTQKQCFDIITRLFIELPTFTNYQLIEITEFCLDSIRLGDPKCLGWKDLLPELLILLNQQATLMVNGFPMSGIEYRQQIVRNLCTMRWNKEILTPIAMMFKEMPIYKEEKSQILGKICEQLLNLNPSELPPLAYQLFLLCSVAQQIFIPILSFNKYYQKHYYKSLFANMNSDISSYDSIEQFSDKEIRDSQETILYHLSKTTEFIINEKDIVNFCRALSATPRYLLSPFCLSAMIVMCGVNRYPESTLPSSSYILPFLRNVIKNNDAEKVMSNESAWCREIFDHQTVDLDKVMQTLINQSKDGMEIITPGLVWLSIQMIKTAGNSRVQLIGMQFLEKFIKRRFIFGQGIVKNLTELLFADLEQLQFAECLTRLSKTNTYTVSECIDSIQRILNFFLLIPGEHAMRMMTFITPLIKISQKIRDLLIDVLRKAMYQRDLSTRQLGVYGFCSVLKHLRENNAPRRATTAGVVGLSSTQIGAGTGRNNIPTIGTQSFFTQPILSGYSLMSLSMAGIGSSASTASQLNNENMSKRNFDILTLEIIGLLRKVFNQQIEMKETLYEGLTLAVNFNPKLTPHILQFIEWHFQSYFNVNEINFEIYFDKIVIVGDGGGGGGVGGGGGGSSSSGGAIDGGDFEIVDSLGKLTQFIGHLVCVCRKHNLIYDTQSIKKLLDTLMCRIDIISIERLGLTSILNHRMNIIGQQYLNCLEALMSYGIWSVTATENNNFFAIILKLFKHHQETIESIKNSNINKSKKSQTKKVKKVTNKDDEETNDILLQSNASSSSSSSSPSLRPIVFQPVNIWTLSTCERFLRVIFDNHISFLTAEQCSILRNHREFGRYILHITFLKIQSLPSLPLYRQIKHSQTSFNQIIQITEIIFKNCLPKLLEMCENFDMISANLTADCFYQCIFVIDSLFKRHFNTFLQGFCGDLQADITTNLKIIISVVENLFEQFISDKLDENNEIEKIPKLLLQCLEIFYSHIPENNDYSNETYNWLFKICNENNLDKKNATIIHKILFEQRIKSNTGIFFNSIAYQFMELLGQINDDEDEDEDENGGCDKRYNYPHKEPQFQLKSITLKTIESSIVFMCNSIKRQIDDVEYVITKAKSYHAKLKITSEGRSGDALSNNCLQSMKLFERKICSQLILIGTTAIPLTNTCLPSGQCMDAVSRLLIQYYVCLCNITKHLILRHATIPISYQGTKFDQLVRIAGHPLASNVYDLIEFIENNIFGAQDQQRFSKNPQADKAKLLRDTKFLPKIILRIENFNKYVILLGKKTKNGLSQYLHIGTVRDFKIKKSALKDALNKSLEIEIDETQMDETESELNDGDVVDPALIDDTSTKRRSTVPSRLITPSSSSSSGKLTGDSEIIIDQTVTDIDQVDVPLRNLALINKKNQRKRKTEENIDEKTNKMRKTSKKSSRSKLPINKSSLSKK